MPSTTSTNYVPDYDLSEVNGDILSYDIVFEDFSKEFPYLIEKWEKETRYRKTNDLEDKSSAVYDNQMEISKAIVLSMIMKKLDYTDKHYRRAMLLMAEMQSGKSATFLNVVYIIKKNEWIIQILGIENIIILLTMSDNELLEQIKKDMLKKVGDEDDFEPFSPKVHIIHGQQVKDKKLKKMGDKNALVIIDECDYAQNIKQKPDELLKHFKVINNGNEEQLKENNVYSLNVSATPMSELVMRRNTNAKTLFFLKSTDDYYGIIKMLRNKKVYDAFNICAESEKFEKIIKENNEKQKTNKYTIIRVSVRNYKNYYEILKDICERNNMNIIELNQGSKDEVSFDERKVPQKHTIVVIKRFWTAGKQMDTKNVSMVFDHITKSSRTDTVIQSLIGRCCGYFKERHGVEIYSSIEMAEEYKTFIQSDFKKVPSNTRNVLSVEGKDGKLVVPYEMNYDNLPETIQEVNEISKSILKDLKSKNLISEEIKVKKSQDTIKPVLAGKEGLKYEKTENGFVKIDYTSRQGQKRENRNYILYTSENIGTLYKNAMSVDAINNSDRYIQVFPIYRNSTNPEDRRYFILHYAGIAEEKLGVNNKASVSEANTL